MWSEETHKGVKCIRWGDEVKATSPAKHGTDDWLVSFNGRIWDDFSIQPTSQAMLFGLGFMGLGQWDCFQGRKRSDLWIGDWADYVVNCRSTNAIRQTVEDNLLMWEQWRARGSD